MTCMSIVSHSPSFISRWFERVNPFTKWSIWVNNVSMCAFQGGLQVPFTNSPSPTSPPPIVLLVGGSLRGTLCVHFTFTSSPRWWSTFIALANSHFGAKDAPKSHHSGNNWIFDSISSMGGIFSIDCNLKTIRETPITLHPFYSNILELSFFFNTQFRFNFDTWIFECIRDMWDTHFW